jgi:hypothetical protein
MFEWQPQVLQLQRKNWPRTRIFAMIKRWEEHDCEANRIATRIPKRRRSEWKFRNEIHARQGLWLEKSRQTKDASVSLMSAREHR